eukprot:TRINITY_DN19080_c0_g1_i2.p1 TRINITY_DN19080_c0_g1~~TRINITY_DN19080_c0_g1_i2.p1  ORF type:complete len:279 (+),score=30.57 TRINITY_DN19080_c0_g1_i2:104-940(+)
MSTSLALTVPAPLLILNALPCTRSSMYGHLCKLYTTCSAMDRQPRNMIMAFAIVLGATTANWSVLLASPSGSRRINLSHQAEVPTHQRDAVASVTAQTRQPRTHLLVDGMNVIGQYYRKRHRNNWQRGAMFSTYPRLLIGAVQAFKKTHSEFDKITIFLDQPRTAGSELKRKSWVKIAKRVWRAGDVDVRIASASSAGESDSADRAIAHLAALEKQAGNSIVVVTNDREVRQAVQQSGGQFQSCQWFGQALKKDQELVLQMEANPQLPRQLLECFSVY